MNNGKSWPVNLSEEDIAFLLERISNHTTPLAEKLIRAQGQLVRRRIQQQLKTGELRRGRK